MEIKFIKLSTNLKKSVDESMEEWDGDKIKRKKRRKTQVDKKKLWEEDWNDVNIDDVKWIGKTWSDWIQIFYRVLRQFHK